MNNEEKIIALLETMQADISGLKSDVSVLKSDVSNLKETQAEIKDVLTKVAVTQEAVVLPRLQLLAEGQKNLLDTLAPKSRVEALEDEMAFMKSVIKALSQEVAELKKAQ